MGLRAGGGWAFLDWAFALDVFSAVVTKAPARLGVGRFCCSRLEQVSSKNAFIEIGLARPFQTDVGQSQTGYKKKEHRFQKHIM